MDVVLGSPFQAMTVRDPPQSIHRVLSLHDVSFCNPALRLAPVGIHAERRPSDPLPSAPRSRARERLPRASVAHRHPTPSRRRWRRTVCRLCLTASSLSTQPRLQARARALREHHLSLVMNYYNGADEGQYDGALDGRGSLVSTTPHGYLTNEVRPCHQPAPPPLRSALGARYSALGPPAIGACSLAAPRESACRARASPRPTLASRPAGPARGPRREMLPPRSQAHSAGKRAHLERLCDGLLNHLKRHRADDGADEGQQDNTLTEHVLGKAPWPQDLKTPMRVAVDGVETSCLPNNSTKAVVHSAKAAVRNRAAERRKRRPSPYSPRVYHDGDRMADGCFSKTLQENGIAHGDSIDTLSEQSGGGDDGDDSGARLRFDPKAAVMAFIRKYAQEKRVNIEDISQQDMLDALSSSAAERAPGRRFSPRLVDNPTGTDTGQVTGGGSSSNTGKSNKRVGGSSSGNTRKNKRVGDGSDSSGRTHPPVLKVTLKDNEAETFRAQLREYNKKFDPDSDVELSVGPEGSVARGISAADGTSIELSFSFGEGSDQRTIKCKADELFTNAGRVTADRWPNGLTVTEGKKGLRLEVSTESVSIVSLHDEAEEAKLTPAQRTERRRAEESPLTFGTEHVLEAVRERQYLRVFDAPQALRAPYNAAHAEADGGQDGPPSAPLFWKTGKGSAAGQVGKDMKLIAYYARNRAVRERNGSEADVILFEYQHAWYVGMTRLGFECWKHILAKARRTPEPSPPPLPHCPLCVC
jgi:hypothetical protein